MSEFDDAFACAVWIEGGYVNDPDDPGGETKYGISKRSYPNEDIPSMTLERSKMIYKRDYWDKIKGDELPAPLSHFVFDAAVNQGVDPAIKMLQRVLNVAQDGILGRNTMIKAKNAGKEICALYLSERALRYTGTRNFDKYGRGWLKRLFVIAMEI